MRDYRFHLDQECGAPATFTGMVAGSSGHRYHVSVTATGAHCSCPGHKYHGKCKHVAAVRAGFCTWTLSGPVQQSFQDNVNMRCPACGSPTRFPRRAAA